MSKSEILVSFDIETDGPCPGLNSMLSLGAVAVDVWARDRPRVLGRWEGNFEPLPEATQDQDTMERFWAKFPEAWEAATRNPLPAKQQMESLAQWSRSLWERNGKRKTFAAAYPAGFDFSWIYYYGHRFLGRSPWSFACFDAKSYAMAVLGVTTFRGTSKKVMPSRWWRDTPPDAHSHVAVEDAEEQGLFMARMIREQTGFDEPED